MTIVFCQLLFTKRRPVFCPTLDDLIAKDIDYSKPIPELPDYYLDWPGKKNGAPKPPIFWVKSR